MLMGSDLKTDLDESRESLLLMSSTELERAVDEMTVREARVLQTSDLLG